MWPLNTQTNSKQNTDDFMDTLFDYIDKFGNENFYDKPYNAVDALVFSQLAYIELEKCFQIDSRLLIRDVWRKITENVTDAEFKSFSSLMQKAMLLLNHAAMTTRYQNVLVFGYKNIVSVKDEKQFSATCFKTKTGECVLAFRGTDETLAGLKESAMLSFTFPVFSQTAAADYLKFFLDEHFEKVHLTGHSKGGNLAVYSAVQNAKKAERILDIFNFDGPGFQKNFVSSEDYNRINDKITTILPEGSMVGQLFCHDEKIRIVESDKSGLSQHHAFNWHIENSDFQYTNEPQYISSLFEKTVNDVFENVSQDKIEEIFETLFSILDATGAKTLDDLKHLRPDKIKAIWKAIEAADKNDNGYLKEVFTLLIRYGFLNALPDVRAELNDRRNELQKTVLTRLGLSDKNTET